MLGIYTFKKWARLKHYYLFFFVLNFFEVWYMYVIIGITR